MQGLAHKCAVNRDTYHRHGTTCEQARQIRANWLNWIATGRAAYAAQLGQEAAGVNAAAQQEAAERLRNLQQVPIHHQLLDLCLT